MSWLIRCFSHSVTKQELAVTQRLFCISSYAFSENAQNGTDLTIDKEPLVLEETYGDVALIGINRTDVRNCVNSGTGQFQI